MFNKTLISFILIISFSVTGQKKELKAVNKLVESQDYNTALEQLLSLKSVVDGSELKYQLQYQFLAGKIYGFLKDFESSFSAFNEAKKLELDNGSSKFTIEINRLLQKFSIDAINKAVEEQNNNNFTESADLLILVYNLDKENNVEYLYFASSMELQADNYDKALIYLNQLRDLNYTGSVEKYYTTDNETGEEIELPFEQYNLLQKSKFNILKKTHHENRFTYSDTHTFIKAIHEQGVTTIPTNDRPLNKTELSKLVNLYEDKFKINDGVYATYETSCYLLQK